MESVTRNPLKTGTISIQDVESKPGQVQLSQSRGGGNKLQSDAILKLDKSLTIQYALIVLVGNLYT